MRVACLHPSPTEILCAIGGQAFLVGRTHACDAPGIEDIPILTRPRAPEGPSPPARARPYHTPLAERLKDLRPDLVLTLADPDDPEPPGLREITPNLRVFRPRSIEDALDEMLTVGVILGLQHAAADAVARLRDRLFSAQERVNAYISGPRIAVIESIRPLTVAGLWTVQLIERAGGTQPLNPTHMPAGAGTGAGMLQAQRTAGPPRTISLLDLAQVDRIIIAPRGQGPAASRDAQLVLATQPQWASLPAVKAGAIRTLDGDRAFGRPGPRLAATLEWLVAWINDPNAPGPSEDI